MGCILIWTLDWGRIQAHSCCQQNSFPCSCYDLGPASYHLLAGGHSGPRGHPTYSFLPCGPLHRPSYNMAVCLFKANRILSLALQSAKAQSYITQHNDGRDILSSFHKMQPNQGNDPQSPLPYSVAQKQVIGSAMLRRRGLYRGIIKGLYSLAVTLPHVCHSVHSYVLTEGRDIEKLPTYIPREAS